MVERKRTRLLNVRMLDAEYQILTELAEREGISVSEWVRNVVRREQAIASAKPQRSKPKRK